MAVQPDATNPDEDPLTNGQEGEDIKKLSHGVAIILLFSKRPKLFFACIEGSISFSLLFVLGLPTVVSC